MKSFRIYVLICFTFFGGFIKAQQDLAIAAKEYFKQQKYSEAIPLFEKHLLSHPQDVNNQRYLALSYQNAGMDQKANHLFKYILAKPNPDSEVYFEYAEFLRNQTDFVAAKEMYLKYAKFNPAIGNYFAQSCDYALAELTKPKNCSLDKIQNEELEKVSVINADLSIKSGSPTKPAKVQQLSSNATNNLLAIEEIINGKAIGKGIYAYSEQKDFVAFTKSSTSPLASIIHQSPITSLYFANIDENGSWSDVQTFEYSSSTYSTNFSCTCRQRQHALFFLPTNLEVMVGTTFM
jgi:tetratricopeptide (TPR) repeat protein